ncbi:hypothetical protein P3342_005894 [Pyrenophora teres f. teres]|uniref:Uncharacterized protein n=2 Tax=Pyrenophora teres f. teres TaxID=97479 RepID=E3RSW9_PYRTT|nr:hypothetical protein PTT_12057 [Pyrenophora teres f. teres 0-1]KAE8854019.1 hypothetical protein HRS9122_01011 [Pyrenophora teres f. teres]KAK1907567.1 hypothetical protein P3342_005894 [Pyrenophora teres f. teres]CAE7026985.1 hypothetical protein PTTW11_04168 [Pyrenophora teres f. teres]
MSANNYNSAGSSRTSERAEADSSMDLYDSGEEDGSVGQKRKKGKGKQFAYEDKSKGKAPVGEESEEGESEGRSHLGSPAANAGITYSDYDSSDTEIDHDCPLSPTHNSRNNSNNNNNIIPSNPNTENPSTMSTTPTDPAVSLLRARALKSSVSTAPAVLTRQTQLPAALSSDPELHLINTLRNDKGLKWADIATQLNAAREKRGEATIWNPASVYSRYILAAPMTATPVGEIGFDARDYVHLRNPGQFYVKPDSSTPTAGASTPTADASSSSKPTPGTSIPRAGRKRVKDYDNATELKANMRQHATAEEVEELQGEVRTQMLVEAVAKVERNFWKLVADEVDRVGGVYFEGDVLAERWFEL